MVRYFYDLFFLEHFEEFWSDQLSWYCLKQKNSYIVNFKFFFGLCFFIWMSNDFLISGHQVEVVTQSSNVDVRSFSEVDVQEVVGDRHRKLQVIGRPAIWDLFGIIIQLTNWEFYQIRFVFVASRTDTSIFLTECERWIFFLYLRELLDHKYLKIFDFFFNNKSIRSLCLNYSTIWWFSNETFYILHF